MGIPDYQTLMLPLLKRLGQETGPVFIKSYLDSIADEFQLNKDERERRIPSGQENLLANRLAWARTYMGKAGLVTSPRRGLVQISEQGRQVLKQGPAEINKKYLQQFPGFAEWATPLQKGSSSRGKNAPNGHKASSQQSQSVTEDDLTPRERIDSAKQEMEAALQTELLQRVRVMSPSDFEGLILRLLLAMGYGQGLDEMSHALGGSGDGGVDGVIDQDPLGMERVYVQAKRWKDGSGVSPHDVRDFIGALNIQRASKGVFVTASQFTDSAVAAAKGSTVQVVLIDGQRLTELMVKYKVGVLVRDVIEIKSLDEGLFEE